MHVRLTGGHPDFANEEVVQCAGVAAFFRDGHRTWFSAGFKWGERNHPLAIVGSLGGLLLTGELDGDFRAWLTPAPDRKSKVALQYGVIGKRGAQFKSGGGEDADDQRGKCEAEFHKNYCA